MPRRTGASKPAERAEPTPDPTPGPGELTYAELELLYRANELKLRKLEEIYEREVAQVRRVLVPMADFAVEILKALGVEDTVEAERKLRELGVFPPLEGESQ